MTIALARPVLTTPRFVMPALRPSPCAPLEQGSGRYAAAPHAVRRPVLRDGSTEGASARSEKAGTTTPHLRITRRGRAVLTLLAAVPLSAGAVMLVSATGAPASIASAPDSSLSNAAASGSDSADVPAVHDAGSDAVPSEYVQVASGDSLWSVAETIAPDVDPREVIDDLVRTNGLESLDVYPGQQLEVPSRY